MCDLNDAIAAESHIRRFTRWQALGPGRRSAPMNGSLGSATGYVTAAESGPDIGHYQVALIDNSAVRFCARAASI